MHVAALSHRHAGVDHKRQDEIGDGARQNDDGALIELGAVQRMRSLFGGHGLKRSVTSRVSDGPFRVKIYISAKRKGGQTPARPPLVDTRDDFRAETKGESVNPQVEKATCRVVPEFMNENDRANQHDERDDIPSEPGGRGQKRADYIHRSEAFSDRGRFGRQLTIMVTNSFTQ